MTLTEIFNKFCKHVDDSIFSEENTGSYVAFVVDQSFVNEFCRLHSIKENELMSSVRNALYRRDILSIKGILAIQLYAASKRANSDGVTEKNYRERLSQVLNWDMLDLQAWMKDYQETSWESLYRWCDTHFFSITKCERKSHSGRYVQYPVKQALRVFTDEDLKYIAASFVDKKLQPGEDIQEHDFWKILGRHGIRSYIVTNHGREVIENSITDEDYRMQIFNYYLRWNGDFKRRNSFKTLYANRKINDYCLYIGSDFKKLDVRKSNLSLVYSTPLDLFTLDELEKYYSFKHEALILFKKDDIYDDTWQETRFLEKGEVGIALCVKGKCRHQIMKHSNNLLFENKKVAIYSVRETMGSSDLYTVKRFYTLTGGLKIGRNIYLQYGCPVLKLEHESKIWLDGNSIDQAGMLSYSFNHLEPGTHSIKIPHFKKMEFKIVSPQLSRREWTVDDFRWKLSRKEIKWESGAFEDGCVGLDFSSIPYTENKSKGSVLERWSKYLLTGERDKEETNIGIKITSIQ